MPNYRIPLPVGASHVMIELDDGTRIPAQPQRVMHAHDGDIPILYVFGGDYFNGLYLEGHWIPVERTAKVIYALIKDGKLVLNLEAPTDGTWTTLVLASMTYLFKGFIIEVSMEVVEASSNYEEVLFFQVGTTRERVPDEGLRVGIRLSSSGSRYEVAEIRSSKPTTIYSSPWSATPVSGVFRIEIGDTLKVFWNDNEIYSDSNWFKNELLYPIICGAAYSVTAKTMKIGQIKLKTIPSFRVLFDLNKKAIQGLGPIASLAFNRAKTDLHNGIIGGGIEVVETPDDTGLYFSADSRYDDADYGNRVRVPGHSDFDFANGYRLGAIVKFDSEQRQLPCDIMMIGEPGAWIAGLIVDDAGYLTAYHHDGNAAITLDSDQKYSDWTEKYVKIVSEWDKSTLKIYIYDAETDSLVQTLSQPVSSIRSYSDQPVGIGGVVGSTIRYLRGTIDRCWIHQRQADGSYVTKMSHYFSFRRRRGDVIVYDTLGEKDESKWIEILNPAHVFKGDCIVDNGLIRLKLDLDLSEESRLDRTRIDRAMEGYALVARFNIHPDDIIRKHLCIVEKITPDEVSIVKDTVFYYNPHYRLRFIIRRGYEGYILENVHVEKDRRTFYFYGAGTPFVLSSNEIRDVDEGEFGWTAIDDDYDNFLLGLIRDDEPERRWAYVRARQKESYWMRPNEWYAAEYWRTYLETCRVYHARSRYAGFPGNPKKHGSEGSLSASTHTILSSWQKSKVKIVSSVAEGLDRAITVQGYDEYGNLQEETITIPAGATEAQGTLDFIYPGPCGIYKSTTSGDLTIRWYDSTNLVWVDWVVIPAADTVFNNGAAISDDNALLDAYNEFVYWTFTNLQKGRYLVAVRAKGTSAVTNDLGINVRNVTDETKVIIPPKINEYDTTTDFSYVRQLIEIGDEDEGDTIRIVIRKMTKTLNGIYVHSVIIFPIANSKDGYGWVVDEAHDFLRDVTVEKRLVKR